MQDPKGVLMSGSKAVVIPEKETCMVLKIHHVVAEEVALLVP